MSKADDVERMWHTDGPYTTDDLIGAANAMAHLVRYLNHATFDTSRTLEYPSQLYRLVGALVPAADRLPQLLGQLAHRAAAYGQDARLGADDMGPVPEQGPSVFAFEAEIYLTEARGPAGSLGADLARAQSKLVRLTMANPRNDE